MATRAPRSEDVDAILDDWPREPRKSARDVIDDYGLPDEAATGRLIWHGNGPWKRTELSREGVPHRFPKKHTDHLEQVIDYPVPPEKASEITRYDGSIMIHRTRGELSARCDREEMNVLALNLAHDIATGEKGVEEARHEHALTALKATMGASPEDTDTLRAQAPSADPSDPDEPLATDEMRERARRRVQNQGR